MKKLLSLAVALFLTAGSERGEASVSPNRVEAEAAFLQQAEKTTVAIDLMIRLGCYHAKRIGKPEVCDGILTSWDGYWKGQFYVHFAGASKDLGDHEPYSRYLELITGVLREALGEWLFVALHLDDLVIINSGLKVAWEPYADSVWCKETTDKPCRDEYRLHANPTFGVASWWGSWAGCTAGTWGLGAVSFLCGTLADLVERVTLKTWGPRLSDRIWDKRNP